MNLKEATITIDQRENYHAEATEDAWQTTAAFINRHNKTREIPIW